MPCSYADTEEEVFVVEPPGLETKNKYEGSLVMKLGRSLYGLAQSPETSIISSNPSLAQLDLLRPDSGIRIYNCEHRCIIIIRARYVHDLLVTGGDIPVIETIKRKAVDKFKVTHVGDGSLALGVRAT